MNERTPLSLTLREQQRREIAAQTEEFLRQGGHIDQVRIAVREATRPVAQVWTETRSGGALMLGL